MPLSIAQVALVVREYDEAIAFFTNKLAFELSEDTPLGDGKRWVIVKPAGTEGARLLLAKAPHPLRPVPSATEPAERVFLFLYTDDIWRDFNAMRSRGVKFLESPRQEPYGTVCVFEDLYSNKWDLLMPATPALK